MTDAPNAITLSAALVAGLAGSGHCVAMCGGLAGALGMRRSSSPGSWRTTVCTVGLQQVGRLIGYAAAGAVFGALGVALRSIVDLPMMAAVVRVAAASLLVLIATRILFGWNALAVVERFGAHFWQSVRPLMQRAANSGSSVRDLMLGLLWGWLPCGFVYSMLLFAALSGDALEGAAIMFAFGTGTLPSMLASSLLASRVAQLFRSHGIRRAIGALLLIFAVWLGWAAVGSMHQPHHVHSGALEERPVRLPAIQARRLADGHTPQVGEFSDDQICLATQRRRAVSCAPLRRLRPGIGVTERGG